MITIKKQRPTDRTLGNTKALRKIRSNPNQTQAPSRAKTKSANDTKRCIKGLANDRDAMLANDYRKACIP